MEQSKAMEYESRMASSDVLKPRNIYRLVGFWGLRFLRGEHHDYVLRTRDAA
jgi:hypothetical protein